MQASSNNVAWNCRRGRERDGGGINLKRKRKLSYLNLININHNIGIKRGRNQVSVFDLDVEEVVEN